MIRMGAALMIAFAGLGLVACEEDGPGASPSPGATPTEPGGGGSPTPTVSPSAPGAVRVVVTDGTLRPLPGVAVTVGEASATTGADGRALVDGIPSGESALVTVSAEGYATTYKRVPVSPEVEATVHVPVQEAGEEHSFTVAEGYTFEDFATGLRMIIPPNALITASGGYGGAALLRQTNLTLSGPGLAGIPGELLATDPNGPPKPLAAYAAVSFELRTAAGLPLSLAAGSAIEVELPLGDARDLGDGAALPLWVFDPADGHYRAAASGAVGIATLLADRRVVRGSISSLGVWVAARARPGAEVPGTARIKGAGARPGAVATVSGGYPAVYATSWAGPDGRFCVRVPDGASASVEVAVDDGGILFTARGAATPGESCDGTGAVVDVSLKAGCIGGEIQADGGGPRVGAAVWSDAATLDHADAAGGFCVMGPADRAVVVRAEGFTDRSTRPAAEVLCDGGAGGCSAQLRFIPSQLGWTFRLADMELAPAGTGLDLDGDGQPDNGLGAALQQGRTGAIATVDKLLDALVERGVLTQDQADDYHDKAVDFFEDVDASIGLEPLQQALDRGSLMWIMDVTAVGSAASMDIYEGLYQGRGFDRGSLIAAFDGTSAAGAIDVGPEDLTVSVPPDDFSLPAEGKASIRILGARTTAQASAAGLTGGLLGGIVPTEDVMAAANILIPEQLGPEDAENGVDLPKEEILAALDEWLTAAADVTLPGGGQGLSATLSYAGLPFSSGRCGAGYWVNDIRVAPAGVGFDLDGDGDVDNASQELFWVIADVVEVALADGLVESGVPNLVAQQAAAYVGELLMAALSLDNVNAKVGDSLGNFRAVPLATVAGAPRARLAMWTGEFTGEGYAPGDLAWELGGTLVAGQLSVSETSMVRRIAPETPTGGEPVTYTITLRLPRARAQVLSTGLSDGLVGYAVTIDQMIALVRSVLDNLQTLPALGEDFGEPFYAELQRTLASGADLDLGDEGKAYSMAYELGAVPACLTTAPAE